MPKARIIALPGNENESLELVFNDDVPDHFKHNLRLGLEAANFKITERRPDGKKLIWECRLVFGETVTEETLEHVKQVVTAA